jgi:hypothetical protein
VKEAVGLMATGSSHWFVPTLIATAFVAVAVGDLVHLARSTPPDELDLLEFGRRPPAFESADRVFDLRARPDNPAAAGSASTFTLVAGWGESTEGGTWSEGERFALRVDVPVGGQRVLLLECRADQRKGPAPHLELTVNGLRVGVVATTKELVIHRLELPHGMIRGGLNDLSFLLVERRGGATASGRTLLLRRLALTGSASDGFPRPRARSQPRVDLEARTVVVRTAGRLSMPFGAPTSGSELTFRYRFREPRADAEVRVTIGRRLTAHGAYDVVHESTLTPGGRARGKVRRVLEERDESWVLVLDVNHAAAQGGFVVLAPRVVAPR